MKFNTATIIVNVQTPQLKIQDTGLLIDDVITYSALGLTELRILSSTWLDPKSLLDAMTYRIDDVGWQQCGTGMN